MIRAIMLSACCLGLVWGSCCSSLVANEDLEAGRKALQRGDLDVAQRLLESAAQDLPQSVEAQIALADCYVKLGLLDQAVARYQIVLKLSPEHRQAKQIISALQGRKMAFVQKLASAQALMNIAAYKEAAEYLRKIVAEAAEPDQRDAAQLLQIEAQLWGGQAGLRAAMELANRSKNSSVTGPARVIAALTLLRFAATQPSRNGNAASLIEAAGELDADWSARGKIVSLFAQLRDASDAARVSREFQNVFAEFPQGPYRTWAETYAASHLLKLASAAIGRGELNEAAQILWPMISDSEMAEEDQFGKPVQISNGWLENGKSTDAIRVQIGTFLERIGRIELSKSNAQLPLHFWLANEFYRQQFEPIQSAKLRLLTTAQLVNLSQPGAQRKTGELLSTADQTQQLILTQLAATIDNEQQRQILVDQLLAQIQRYKQAGDLATGLAQWVKVTPQPDGTTDIQLLLGSDPIPSGDAHRKLLSGLATGYSQLGDAEFRKDLATLKAGAGESIYSYDRVALQLFGQLMSTYTADSGAIAGADAIVKRFTDSGHWPAAFDALNIFYRSQPASKGRWAKIHLQMRQAANAEDQLLALNRKLGEQPSDLVQSFINEVTAILKSDPRESTRKIVIATIQPLIGRYIKLGRMDLANKIVELATNGHDHLNDWALWEKINLAERQAIRALATHIGELGKDEKIALNGFHDTELKLIDQLLAEHDQSPYRVPVVERVLRISSTYQQYQSFQVASDVLKRFLAANPDLRTKEKVEFQLVRVALQKAHENFATRTDKQDAPTELTAEFSDAIKLLSEFLAAHPTGTQTAVAQAELFKIVTVYGKQDAWPVAREVLNRFAESVPDFRSPLHLKLLKAATYLGELDRDYGVSLLSPAPKDKAGPASFSGPIDSLAVNLPESQFKKLSDKIASAAENEAGASSGADAPIMAGSRIRRADTDDIKYAEGEIEAFGDLVRKGYSSASKPSESALAMIRQSQQRQFQQLAMLEDNRRAATAQQESGNTQESQSIALPSGIVLSEAEMKRQDEAADNAYAILIDIINAAAPRDKLLKDQARLQVMWLFGFFEGQLRPDRAIVMINRFLDDQPNDSAKVALSYQAITNQLKWAGQKKPTDRVNLQWLQQRHERFDQARKSIEDFVSKFDSDKSWVDRALLLTAHSYESEAAMTQPISAVRAGGLLVRSADALISLMQSRPDHPQCNGFAQRLWNIADRLRRLGQLDAAIYVLSQVPIRFPTEALAQQSVLRIAELHSTNLNQPLKAVETYQEFLSLNGDNEQVRTQIFEIARQLAARQRYLESLHVYGVFVDSFPNDPRAPQALMAVGQTQQANEAWDDAITTYRRILTEFSGVPIVPSVKMSVAQCLINLSRWREAKRQYEEFVRQYPKDKQLATAQAQIELLKKLDRYESLLADQAVARRKDDAQFEIGRIVLTQLQNRVKAIQEFGKVVANYPNSDVADDAQLEIGIALLAMERIDEARQALLKVPANYPNSPLADDALFFVAQSYENQAARLGSVTLESAREKAILLRQRGAYQDFNQKVDQQLALMAKRRVQLKREGKNNEIALDEAAQSFRMNSLALSGLSNTARRAEQQAETESALQVANRRDRINEANREAVKLYVQAATDYPLGDKTDDSLLKIARIFETQLKDRPAAMQAYQKIVKLFPGTPVAEDAAWNVANFYEQEGDFKMAANALRDFIRNYPASSRIADAQYSLAEVLEELGQWIDAMDEYETFRQKFSKHPKAVAALEQINWIRTYRK